MRFILSVILFSRQNMSHLYGEDSFSEHSLLFPQSQTLQPILRAETQCSLCSLDRLNDARQLLIEQPFKLVHLDSTYRVWGFGFGVWDLGFGGLLRSHGLSAIPRICSGSRVYSLGLQAYPLQRGFIRPLQFQGNISDLLHPLRCRRVNFHQFLKYPQPPKGSEITISFLSKLSTKTAPKAQALGFGLPGLG